eukprot:m.264877 g.264877  ORF g.264877 m.264877 type:complete len:139 (+) comp28314_c0_seq1:478-894(+)
MDFCVLWTDCVCGGGWVWLSVLLLLCPVSVVKVGCLAAQGFLVIKAQENKPMVHVSLSLFLLSLFPLSLSSSSLSPHTHKNNNNNTMVIKFLPLPSPTSPPFAHGWCRVDVDLWHQCSSSSSAVNETAASSSAPVIPP